MKWLKWEKGRQNTGYYKMLLFRFKILKLLGFDLYILKSFPGVEVPEHSDVVEGFRHYRVNLILKKSKIGGEFFANEKILDWPRLKIFPSDRPHSVSKIEKGKRIVLSLGIAFKK